MSDADTPAPPTPKRLGVEAPPQRKRFYRSAAPVAVSGGYEIHLDGRALKTPRKLQFILSNQTLANAIAAEWEAQGTHLDPASMQLTTLAFTAIDAVADQHTAVAAEIGRYAMSDLLCYRADGPAELIARQVKGWDPVIAATQRDLGVTFKTATGLMPVEQSPNVAHAIEARLAGATALDLAATHVLTTLTGSAVLAMAVRARQLLLDEAWRLAHLDEEFQAERWGQDSEAEARQRTRLATARAAAFVLSCTDLD